MKLNFVSFFILLLAVVSPIKAQYQPRYGTSDSTQREKWQPDSTLAIAHLENSLRIQHAGQKMKQASTHAWLSILLGTGGTAIALLNVSDAPPGTRAHESAQVGRAFGYAVAAAGVANGFLFIAKLSRAGRILRGGHIPSSPSVGIGSRGVGLAWAF